MSEKKETDFQRKLNRILSATEGDVVLKEVTIEFDELELKY
ncbi:MAG: hypothetical protein ACTSRS_05615 [Candidatus Helarchaeota archaeon]